jgi:ribosomal protein S18 acetylase RimI-like enzyme
MIIRSLKKSEIPSAVEIVRRNHSWTDALWAKKELLSIFIPAKHKLNYSDALCAVLDRRLVGFLVYSWSWVDNNVAELYWLNVIPEYHYQGIGRLLVSKLIARLRGIPESNKYKPTLLISSRKWNVMNRYKDLGFKKIIAISKDNVLVGVKL